MFLGPMRTSCLVESRVLSTREHRVDIPPRRGGELSGLEGISARTKSERGASRSGATGFRRSTMESMDETRGEE